MQTNRGDMSSETGPDGEPQDGLARELARMNLPSKHLQRNGHWKVTCTTLFHFCVLPRRCPRRNNEIRVLRPDAICNVSPTGSPAALPRLRRFTRQVVRLCPISS